MGGGIIGLEMGTVYHALGSQIDVVEMFDQVIPAADKDIVKLFTKRISSKFNLMLETKVTAVEAKEDGIYVTMEGKKGPAEPQRYDAVLVAIGRTPNGKLLAADKAPASPRVMSGSAERYAVSTAAPMLSIPIIYTKSTGMNRWSTPMQTCEVSSNGLKQ